MANYKFIITKEDQSWPAYVSTFVLERAEFRKAEQVLEKGLVTLEAYGGPRYLISHLKYAQITAIYLYEIIADLIDSKGDIKECQALILNEPWMKANSIVTATFEFLNDKGYCEERLVMKRKKSLRYYKDNEMLYEKDENYQEPMTTKM